jgi:hypothetical protein
MKKASLLLLTIIMGLAVFAQDKVYNDANAEKRSVSGFHAVSVSGGIDLFLTQGNEEAVAVSASEKEYRDKIKTVVENGVLKISYETNWYNWSWRTNRKLKAYVSVKNLDGLTASGGSDVKVEGTLSAAKLNIDLSGGSDFKGAVSVTDLGIDKSGGSDLDISGRATNVKIDASGGSDVNAYGLTTDNCYAECSGGSDVTITVNKELEADASGGSDIHYKGSAVIKKKSSSGGSSVSKRG